MAITRLAVGISDDARAGLHTALERTGMPQIQMITRLCEWFGRADPNIQNLLLGINPPESERAIVRAILEQMAVAHGPAPESEVEYADETDDELLDEMDAKRASEDEDSGRKKRRKRKAARRAT